jgi:hypothetical protein
MSNLYLIEPGILRIGSCYLRNLKFLIALAFVFSSNFATASDESLLYFDSDEIGVINDPSKIDGEYYSDILAFRLTTDNQLNFSNSKNGYDISVGSISSKRFVIQQRLKLNQEISENFNLQLNYFEQGEFEIDRSHLMAGLSYDVNSFLKLGFNVSLFSEKKENDFGVTALYRLNKKNSLKFFITFPDFAFNDRNEGPELNTRQTKSFGVIGRYSSGSGSDVEYFLLNNSKLKRTLVDSNNTYEFSDKRAGIKSRFKFYNYQLNLNLEGFEGAEGLYAALEPEEIWQRRGVRILIQTQFAKWTFGIEKNWRAWELNSEKVLHQNLMPHAWYRIATGTFFEYIDLGLETSIHNGSGPTSLRNELDKDNDLNSRFNTRLGFRFSETAFLNLLLSYDLDDASWEGGGGQFQALF